MEKESGSWFPYQRFELPPLYSNISDSLPLRGKLPNLMNPCMKEACPMDRYSGLPLSEPKQTNEPCNWFYFAPPLAKEKNVSNDVSEKQFIVFDKSGDRTSVIKTPLGFLTCWNIPKPPTSFGVLKENANPRVFSSFQNLEDNNNNNNNNNNEEEEELMENEMDENTDELNALLYCDDEYNYSEEDDVTSTGHSPSTIIDHEIREHEHEEVASSKCSIKRHKLLDGSYGVPFKCSELEEDDAASYSNRVSGDSYVSLSGKKRSKTEKIQKKLNILQNIIPGTKGNKKKKKNPIAVIDEAVNYLKFLKEKAEFFGLDSP